MSNWFTSTFDSVREKSLNAIEFVRKDLSEFTTTVKNDTENYLQKIKTQPGSNLGINEFVSKFSSSISSSKNNYENPVTASASFDRLKSERTRLQNDESTYLTDPAPIESYQAWRETNDFDIDKRKGEIAQLLIDAPNMRSLYVRLVPACTTHNDFWCRYYYRWHKLDEEETRRVTLLKRAHEICNESNENNWDDEPVDEWKSDNAPCERKESEAGDSWDQDFDETTPVTSTNEFLSSDQSETISPSVNLPTEVSLEPLETVTKTKPDISNENIRDIDDEWETWS